MKRQDAETECVRKTDWISTFFCAQSRRLIKIYTNVRFGRFTRSFEPSDQISLVYAPLTKIRKRLHGGDV